MDDGSVTTTASRPPAFTRGKAIGIAVAQLVLVPVLFLVGFGFLFVGMGLDPDSTGEVLTARDVVVLVLYAVVFLTVLLLLIGAPLLLLARKYDRPRWERRAAVIPLGFAAASAAILLGLGVAGAVFDQAAGV